MPRFTIASFNTHWGLDRRGVSFDVLGACRRLDADVLVLQEAWREDGDGGYAAAAASALGYALHSVALCRGNIAATPRTRPPAGWASTGELTVAILSRLPVRTTRTIDLGRLRLDDLRRAALEVELDVGGSVLSVTGTHLSHLSHGSLIQLRRLRLALAANSRQPALASGARRTTPADNSQPAVPAGDACAAVPARDARPGVLAGDMNMWGPLLSACLPGWRRAVLGRTWPDCAPHSQIDHIMVTPQVRVLAGRVIGGLGSDHRAVRAELEI